MFSLTLMFEKKKLFEIISLCDAHISLVLLSYPTLSEFNQEFNYTLTNITLSTSVYTKNTVIP